MGNPLIESLWYFSHVYSIIAHSDVSDGVKAAFAVCSCLMAAPLVILSNEATQYWKKADINILIYMFFSATYIAIVKVGGTLPDNLDSSLWGKK